MADIKSLYSEYVKSLDTYIMFKIAQEAARLTPELSKRNRTPIKLSMGAPAQRPPEFVINALSKAMQTDSMHTYSSPKGEMFFLEAVAQRMKKRFGVEFDPKTEIFSLIGSKEGLANMFRTLINPTLNDKEQDIIMIPDPGYASYKEQIKVVGGLAYPIPLTKENNYMPDMNDVVAQLEKDGYSRKKIKAIVVNYPNNPLGVTATKEYLKSVVDFCKANNYLLISDLAYADMFFGSEEAPFSIFEIEGAKDIAIEFHSFSKPYAMTGWRIGWACGHPDAVGILGKLKSTVDTGVFKAIQKASADILLSEEGDAYIEQSNKNYEVKQKIITDGFKELGWDIDSLSIPKTTFYLWLPIPKKYKTSVEFCQDILEKSGIVLVPGTAFGSNGEGCFRLSFVASDDNLKEVIRRMKEDGFTFN